MPLYTSRTHTNFVRKLHCSDIVENAKYTLSIFVASLCSISLQFGVGWLYWTAVKMVADGNAKAQAAAHGGDPQASSVSSCLRPNLSYITLSCQTVP
jgi:hypothetical protein